MNERRAISIDGARTILLGLGALGMAACTCGGEPVAPAPPDPAPVAVAPAAPIVGVLIVGSEDGEAGAPSVGRLEILEPSDGWHAEVVYDGNSRSLEDVIATPAGVLTLGAERAMVRAWHAVEGAWSGDVVWAEDFGALPARAAFASRGTLRPGHEEIALAVATHGIVASLAPSGEGWAIERVVTEPGSTIEALAVLDVAGDGTAEIVAAIRAGASPEVELRSFVVEEGGATSERLGALVGRMVALALEPGPAGSRGILALVAPAEGAARVERLGVPGGEASTLFTLEGGAPRDMIASDLDADGAAELVVSQPEGVFVYRHADGGWARTALVERRSELGPPIAVIDLEQDGPAEVVAVWDATGEVVAYDGTSAHVLHTRASPSPRDHSRAIRPLPR